jgi:NAD-dependent deacetylase
VSDLLERAGSNKVLHLHGELTKVRSSLDETLVYDWHEDCNIGDKCEKGSQLRPHIVWFGEMVPALEEAISITEQADYVAVIGTSLQVYPAASLMHYAKPNVPVFYIDPRPASITNLQNPLEVIDKNATEGVPILREKLLRR